MGFGLSPGIALWLCLPLLQLAVALCWDGPSLPGPRDALLRLPERVLHVSYLV